MLLFWDRFAVTKPLSQIQRSTLWPLQDADPTPSFGGFGPRQRKLGTRHHEKPHTRPRRHRLALSLPQRRSKPEPKTDEHTNRRGTRRRSARSCFAASPSHVGKRPSGSGYASDAGRLPSRARPVVNPVPRITVSTEGRPSTEPLCKRTKHLGKGRCSEDNPDPGRGLIVPARDQGKSGIQHLFQHPILPGRAEHPDPGILKQFPAT